MPPIELKLLRDLRISRIDMVDLGDNLGADILIAKGRPRCAECNSYMEAGSDTCPDCGTVKKAALTTAQRNALPDPAFAAKWKDEKGNDQRALPIHDAAHAAAATGGHGIDATKGIPEDVKAGARKKIDAAQKKFGVGKYKKNEPVSKMDMSSSHQDAPIGSTDKPNTSSVEGLSVKPGKKKGLKKKPVYKSMAGVPDDDAIVINVVVEADDDDEDDAPPTFEDVVVNEQAANRMRMLHDYLDRTLGGLFWNQDLTAEEKQASIAAAAEDFADAIREVPTDLTGIVVKRSTQGTVVRQSEGQMKEVTVNLSEIPETQRAAVTALLEVTKRIPALESEIVELKKRIPAETEEEVQKRLLPEAVRKRLDLQEEEIKKMRETGEEMEEVKKAASLPLKGLSTPEKFGPLMYRIKKNRATPEDAVELERIVKAANAQANLAKVIGHTIGADGTGQTPEVGSAAEQIEKKAHELQAEKPKKFGSLAVAREEVRKRNPDLRKAERAELDQKSA